MPEPGAGEVLIRVHACGVCRTDLHVLDGEVRARHPIVPGHQIIGTVEGTGERVGVPVAGLDGRHAAASAPSGRENLCDNAQFTGADRNGGFAEYTVADPRFCFPIPAGFADLQAAPLLCAGLIGHRALRMTGDAERLGLYGFGASAHIVAQVALHQGRRVFAFTREGDTGGQDFAREIGAEWAGESGELPPEELDAAIIFAPAGRARPARPARARQGRDRGLRRDPHERHPRRSRTSCSGASARSARSPTSPAATARSSSRSRREVPVRTTVTEYPLARAGEALEDLRAGRFHGAAVVVP